MLKKHSWLAQEVGIPPERIFVCRNGEVVTNRGRDLFLSEKKIIADPIYIYNEQVVLNEELQRDLFFRNLMGESGILVVIVLNSKDGSLFSPVIFTYGFLNMQKNRSLIEWWRRSIKNYLDKEETEERKVFFL